MPRSLLTPAQRLEIARERAAGTSAALLAARFDVTRRTIHNVQRQMLGNPSSEEGRSRVVGVRLTDTALRALDARAAAHGQTRAGALRRLVEVATSGLVVEDAAAADQLRQVGVELHRLGVNVNQVARACNEARLWGQPIPFTEADRAAVHEGLRHAFAVADAVRGLVSRRRLSVEAAVSALLTEGHDEAA